jgi:acyl-CoA synthetase (AMP-forming)/AMP-acid ligase II
MGDPALLPSAADPSGGCRWIYYTSGTTADPKGVRHSDSSVIASSNGVVDQIGMRAGDVYPIAWPFAHIGGVSMLASALRAGGTLVLFDAFDAETTPDRMALHSPTILGSATPFFHSYIAAQRRAGETRLFPRLRACVAGGAPTPESVNDATAEVLQVRGVVGAWGLTEFPVASSETPDDDALGSTVGRLSSGVEVRLVEGELRLRGPQQFLGYVDSSLDADAYDEEGWFRTGDLGAIGDDGRIRIVGRLKDVIIRNAENISAQEVEEVLLLHPDVADAAVVGVADPRTGEQVCAFVVARPEADFSAGALVEHCAEHGLAPYKRPTTVRLVAALPRNSMGKVLKATLRTWAVPT